MRFWKKKTPVWDQGDDIHEGKGFRLRNAPKSGKYRVVDRYGSPCLQSSIEDGLWKFVEIYVFGLDEYYPDVEWTILGVDKPSTAQSLLDMARSIRGDGCHPVIATLDTKQYEG